MLRRLAVPLFAAALMAATAAPAHAATREDGRREPASITVSTLGNGHGKGLSQYGARNRATDGQTYREIVEHYYPNTEWGTAGDMVRVLIKADTTDDVVVGARTGLKARSLGSGKTWTLPAKRGGQTIARWKITAAAGEKSAVSYLAAGRWTAWRHAPGDAEFTAGGQPMNLYTPDGVVAYRGNLRSASVGNATRNTVNVVKLDVYLRGVVPQEIPGSWPAAAVQAQAVAARTYAVFERGNVPPSRYYDLCDTDLCQVYGGASAEYSGSDAAVAATAGEILTYSGAPIFAQFSASNGGYSVDGGYPYLVAEEDPFDHGYPGDPHAVTFTGDQVTRHWAGLGDLVSVEVTERDGKGPYGGRVTKLLVTGTEGTATPTGSQFRSYLGLRTTLFTVS
jgi:stage II sporulation protein D